MSIINFYNDRFEVKTLFNKKGKYKIQIYGNDGSEEQYYDMLEYVAIVKNDALSKLEFPQTYKEAKNINIIEPLYNNLKTGKFVKFKMTSNYDDIIIIDREWHYLKRNIEGYFELETKIKTKNGYDVIVGYKNSEGSCSYLVSYKIH